MNERKDEFINKLTIKAQLCGIETVKIVYDSLVKLIVYELREKGEVFLPDIGTINVKFMTKKNISLRNNENTVSSSTPVIKFIPWYAFKLYLKRFFMKK